MRKAERVLSDHERELQELEDKYLSEFRRDEDWKYVFGALPVWLRNHFHHVEARKMVVAAMKARQSADEPDKYLAG